MADDAGFVNGQLPLKGVVLCCTSVTQDVRTMVQDVATQMGAVHKLDLTSDVTHLLVGSVTTPKYRYVAKDRPDIKVLHPNWLEAARQSWLEGGDVDVASIDNDFRLPPFYGLKVCITGFDKLDERNLISNTVVKAGAEYHGDLTKQVTHLIAAVPRGEKYTHAKQWGISIVSLRWFEDSLRRGMALDESLYDPVLPVEEQGKDAFRTVLKQRTSLGKRTREDEPKVVEEVGKRKLRRTASTRLNSQSQDMWQDMSAREDNSETLDVDQWQEDVESGAREGLSNPALPPAKRRTPDNEPKSEAIQEPSGLLAGRSILIYGFDSMKAKRLQQFLEPNGANVVQSASELEHASRNAFYKARYLLVPHALNGSLLQLPNIPPGTEVVTEWWVERCIHHKCFLEPAENVLSQPLWNAKIDAFADMTVCATGFGGVDFRQTAEAVKLTGASYVEKLSQSTSVLICGSTTIKPEKSYYAAKHNITVVSADWLWKCLREKRKVAFDKFQISLPFIDLEQVVREPSTSGSAPREMPQGQFNSPTKVRDDMPPIRLSNARKRHITPTLSLLPSKSTAPIPVRRSELVIQEDADDAPLTGRELLPAPASAATSPHRTVPLQDISPNASPCKFSPTSECNKMKRSAINLGASDKLGRDSPVPRPPSPKRRRCSPTKEEPPVFVVRPQEELTADLHALMKHQSGSRPESSGPEAPLRRKSRPLGRNLSGISNRSVSASAPSETTSPALPSEALGSAADGFSFSKELPLPPSTQLGYETQDAEAHRLQISKRTGLTLDADTPGRRVASVGTVKDSVISGGEAAVGNRIRSRPRTK